MFRKFFIMIIALLIITNLASCSGGVASAPAETTGATTAQPSKAEEKLSVPKINAEQLRVLQADPEIFKFSGTAKDQPEMDLPNFYKKTFFLFKSPRDEDYKLLTDKDGNIIEFVPPMLDMDPNEPVPVAMMQKKYTEIIADLKKVKLLSDEYVLEFKTKPSAMNHFFAVVGTKRLPGGLVQNGDLIYIRGEFTRDKYAIQYEKQQGYQVSKEQLSKIIPREKIIAKFKEKHYKQWMDKFELKTDLYSGGTYGEFFSPETPYYDLSIDNCLHYVYDALTGEEKEDLPGDGCIIQDKQGNIYYPEDEMTRKAGAAN